MEINPSQEINTSIIEPSFQEQDPGVKQIKDDLLIFLKDEANRQPGIGIVLDLKDPLETAHEVYDYNRYHQLQPQGDVGYVYFSLAKTLLYSDNWKYHGDHYEDARKFLLGGEKQKRHWLPAEDFIHFFTHFAPNKSACDINKFVIALTDINLLRGIDQETLRQTIKKLNDKKTPVTMIFFNDLVK